MSQPVLLAVDIERTGDDPIDHSTIALGMCVMHCGKVLAKRRWNAYSDDVKFDPRCYREFWCSRVHLLKSFESSGTQYALQTEMIRGFQAFRVEWETKAMEMGVGLVLVTDCPEYDIYHLNCAIVRLTSDPPMPYSATPNTNKFLRLWSSDSLCRGVLAKLDPEFQSEWGVNSRLRKLLNVKGPDATHLPEDDAESHAFDASLALGYLQ